MKKILTLILILSFIATASFAKEAPAVSDTLSGWNYSWEAGLSGSQASYSNWSQGGVNNIAVTGNSILTAKFRENRFSYSFRLNTRFGQTRIQDEGVRKIDDRFEIRNRFLYDIGRKDGDFKLFGNVNFRTQFAEGYDYGAEDDGTDRLISNFMAPAYISQNAGLAYIPTENFSFEAGVGLLQTIVNDSDVRQNNRYGVPEGDNFKNEAGITLGAAYDMRLGTNLSLSTSAETFTNVNKSIKSTNVDVAAQVTGRINNYMNASLRLDFVYDDDFSKELQIAQVLSVGVSFILL